MNNNRMRPIIRMAAGMYLLYSAYTLGKAYLNGEADSIFMIIGALVFLVFGAVFLFTGVKELQAIAKMEKKEAEEAAAAEPEAVVEETKEPEEEKKLSISERARRMPNLAEDEETKE